MSSIWTRALKKNGEGDVGGLWADLTLRMRDSMSRLQRVQQSDIRNEDQWCVEYEERIRFVGGIDAGSKIFAVYEKVLLSRSGARRP